MRHLLVLAFLAACHAATPARAPAPAATPAVATAPHAGDAQAQAAYDAHDWLRCGQLFDQLGAAGPHRDGALYNAACCYARAGQADRAFAELDRAIAAGFFDHPQAVADADLATLHDDPRWTAELAAMDRAMLASEKAITDPGLRDEIIAMVGEDQARRKAWIAHPSDEQLHQRVMEIDRADTVRMKQIVAKVGWPGKKLVGIEAAHDAWLLVQHADADRAFQRQCLQLLERAVAAGEAYPADYAYLYDRLAVADHRPQRYGTQFHGDAPAPLEDPAHVDERRKSVGLGPLAEYAAQIRAMYGTSFTKPR